MHVLIHLLKMKTKHTVVQLHPIFSLFLLSKYLLESTFLYLSAWFYQQGGQLVWWLSCLDSIELLNESWNLRASSWSAHWLLAQNCCPRNEQECLKVLLSNLNVVSLSVMFSAAACALQQGFSTPGPGTTGGPCQLPDWSLRGLL